MQLCSLWRARRAHVSAEERIVRFRRILQSAQSFPHYRRALRVADLDTREAMRGVDNIAAALERLPVQPETMMFRDAWAKPRMTPRLCHPLAITSRTAIVAADFQAEPDSRLFRWSEDTRALESFAPQTIAADVFHLRAIAGAMETGHLSLRPLRHAVIAFSGAAQGDLTQRDLDILWRVFQVPTFEQRLGGDGVPIARECEVHDGLHVALENAVVEQIDGELVLTSLTDTACPVLRVRTGYAATMVEGLCHCGRAESRIRGLARLERHTAALSAGAN